MRAGQRGPVVTADPASRVVHAVIDGAGEVKAVYESIDDALEDIERRIRLARREGRDQRFLRESWPVRPTGSLTRTLVS